MATALFLHYTDCISFGTGKRTPIRRAAKRRAERITYGMDDWPPPSRARSRLAALHETEEEAASALVRCFQRSTLLCGAKFYLWQSISFFLTQNRPLLAGRHSIEMQFSAKVCACQLADHPLLLQVGKPLTKRQKAMLQSRALKRFKGPRKSAAKASARATSPKLSHAGSIDSSLNIQEGAQRVHFQVLLLHYWGPVDCLQFASGRLIQKALQLRLDAARSDVICQWKTSPKFRGKILHAELPPRWCRGEWGTSC